jgi:hypothetical protein
MNWRPFIELSQPLEMWPESARVRQRAAARFVGKFEADVAAGTRKSKRSAACPPVHDHSKSLERLIVKMPCSCRSGNSF